MSKHVFTDESPACVVCGRKPGHNVAPHAHRIVKDLRDLA